MIDLEYLSHSRLELFEQCPLAFLKKYGDGAKDVAESDEYGGATNHYALHGSALHVTLQHWGEHQQAGDPVNVKQLVEFMEGVYPPASAFPQNKYFEYLERALYTTKTFMKYNEGIVPLYVEKMLLTKIDDDLPVFKMVIDRVDGSEETSSAEWDVIDYKSAIPYTKKKLEDKFQLTIYGKGVERVEGDMPRRCQYYHICHNHKIPVYLTPDRVQRDMDRIKRIYDRILAETVWGGRFDWFFCNKICDFGFNKQCDFLKKQVYGGTTQKAAGLKWGNKVI